MNEAEIQNQIRLQASELGWRLWRNNVGAGKLEGGPGKRDESGKLNALDVKVGDRVLFGQYAIHLSNSSYTKCIAP